MDIAKIVEEIKHLPNVFVDCNYKQGLDALKEHFIIHGIGLDQMDLYIKTSQQQIANLIKMFEPHLLPTDYLFFLEYYGGLVINDGNKPILDIFGTGPLADVTYSPVAEVNRVSSASTHKNVYIAGGDVLLSDKEKEVLLEIKKFDTKLPNIVKKNMPKSQHISFYIDIQSSIQAGSIIAIKDIEIKIKSNKWEYVAPSFTNWLKMILESGGKYGFI